MTASTGWMRAGRQHQPDKGGEHDQRITRGFSSAK